MNAPTLPPTPGRPTTIVVFGTGALAMLVGARLARAGAEVTLAGTWREGLEALDRKGIRITDRENGTWHQAISAVHIDELHRSGRAPADLAIVAAKSHQTRSLAPRVAQAAHRVLTLQNGLGNLELLEAFSESTHVMAGVVHRGATRLGPGRVRDAGGGPTILPAADRWLLDLFAAAALDPQPSDNIEAAMWLKLAVNCAINPLTALQSIPNGAILDDSHLRDMAEDAAREVGRLAEALCIELGRDPATWALEVARATAGNRSSMLQDLDARRPTEIDALCGAVVQRSREAGLASPVNLQLWRQIKERETASLTIRPTQAPRQPRMAGPA